MRIALFACRDYILLSNLINKNIMNNQISKYLTTRQAAAFLDVSLGTVQNMVESGLIDAWKTIGGHRRIAYSTVENLLKQRDQLISEIGGAKSNLDIIVLESDPHLKNLYHAELESLRLPINLRTVSSGFECMLQIGKKIPDIFITDLAISDLDGFQMVNYLQENPVTANIDILAVKDIYGNAEQKIHLLTNVVFVSKRYLFPEIKGFIVGRFR